MAQWSTASYQMSQFSYNGWLVRDGPPLTSLLYDLHAMPHQSTACHEVPRPTWNGWLYATFGTERCDVSSVKSQSILC